MNPFIARIVEIMESTLGPFLTTDQVYRRNTVFLAGAEDMMVAFGMFPGGESELKDLLAEELPTVVTEVNRRTIHGYRVSNAGHSVNAENVRRIIREAEAAVANGSARGQTWMAEFCFRFVDQFVRRILQTKYGGVHTCWDSTLVGNAAHCLEDTRFVCWNGERVLDSTLCPPRGSVRCWDGSVAASESQCPPRVLGVVCWDGSRATTRAECPPDTRVTCWDGTTVDDPSLCSRDTRVRCWNGTLANSMGACPPDTRARCWDGSVAERIEACPPDRRITCWNGDRKMAFSECPPDTRPQCWNGKRVNALSECPPEMKTCSDGSLVPVDAQCPSEPFLGVFSIVAIAIIIVVAYALFFNDQGGADSDSDSDSD